MPIMAFASLGMVLFLGSSMAIAFVLHPAGEGPAESANSAITRHIRCQAGSLHSIRKELLQALNLQSEPRLPAGSLDGIREQWKRAFSAIAHRAKDNPTHSVAPHVGDNRSWKCCSMLSEIFMTDLGWDNWVIYPGSITIVKCASCSPDNPLRCPSSHTSVQETQSQESCCQPTSQEMVPIVYMDELGNLVISSVPLSRGCACGRGGLELPVEE